MNALLIATLSGAGVACTGTCLIGAWWHRRRMRLLTARIAGLHAEIDRLRAQPQVARSAAAWRIEPPSIRLSTVLVSNPKPLRRRLWQTLRSRTRTLGDRQAALTVALPFLDTVASTRHTASSNDSS